MPLNFWCATKLSKPMNQLPLFCKIIPHFAPVIDFTSFIQLRSNWKILKFAWKWHNLHESSRISSLIFDLKYWFIELNNFVIDSKPKKHFLNEKCQICLARMTHFEKILFDQKCFIYHVEQLCYWLRIDLTLKTAIMKSAKFA